LREPFFVGDWFCQECGSHNFRGKKVHRFPLRRSYGPAIVEFEQRFAAEPNECQISAEVRPEVA
jgi:hypothetical protein